MEVVKCGSARTRTVVEAKGTRIDHSMALSRKGEKGIMTAVVGD